MYPILFAIGHLKFYSFGTFIALGTLLGGYFIFRAARFRKLKTHHLFDTVLFTLLLALIGARITYYFVYQNQFQNFFQLFFFWQGGLLGLGGLITGFLAFWYFIRQEKDPVWQLLDIGALGLLLAWSVGKFGCFLSACSYGRATSSFLGIHGTYPIDLFAAIWTLALFTVLFLSWRRARLSDGVIFFLATEGFFLGDLLIKTLKADFGEGLAQLEAVVNLALIIAIYFIFWRIHGPRFEKRSFGTSVRNLVFRRKKQ